MQFNRFDDSVRAQISALLDRDPGRFAPALRQAVEFIEFLECVSQTEVEIRAGIRERADPAAAEQPVELERLYLDSLQFDVLTRKSAALFKLVPPEGELCCFILLMDDALNLMAVTPIEETEAAARRLRGRLQIGP